MLGVCKVQQVDQTFTIFMVILRTLKENLFMDHNHMKQQANQSHSECEFVEGGKVFILMKPYNYTSLKSQHCQKISPKCYGP
jgi:hypothetical protein